MSEQDALFDADVYGKTRRLGPRKPSMMRTVAAGGVWALLTGVEGIDDHAHRFTGERTGQGADVTRCGRDGRRVDIPDALTVRPCEACEAAE